MIAGAPGFALAAARRSTWALWGAALCAVALLDGARQVGSNLNLPPEAQADNPLFGDAFLRTIVFEASCLVVGLLAGDEAVARGAGPRRGYVVAVPATCLAGSVALALWFILVGHFLGGPVAELTLADHAALTATQFVNVLGVCSLCAFVHVDLRRARRAATLRRRAQITRLQARRHAQHARLQATQARIEPTFLFDTLARVRALYEREEDRAGQALDDLIHYFRTALPTTHARSSTLGSEAALARAWLALLRVRFGDGFVSEIDVPPPLAPLPLAPMVLLPLLECALVRDAPAAGAARRVDVRATLDGGTLRLSVTDSGASTPAPGLPTLAERLRALHGDAAALSEEPLAGGGTRFLMELPHAIPARPDR